MSLDKDFREDSSVFYVEPVWGSMTFVCNYLRGLGLKEKRDYEVIGTFGTVKANLTYDQIELMVSDLRGYLYNISKNDERGFSMPQRRNFERTSSAG